MILSIRSHISNKLKQIYQIEEWDQGPVIDDVVTDQQDDCQDEQKIFQQLGFVEMDPSLTSII